MRPFGNFVTVISMKLLLTVLDTRIKKKASKEKLANLNQLSAIFLKFLSKNPHFKAVKLVTLNLTLCGKTKIKNLNHDYRSIDKVTDVLSFGVHENLRPDIKQKQNNPPILDLGDIFICKDVAAKQAREFDISYEQEIFHLATHGFLHLLGFDHELSLKEEKIMEAYEAELIKIIYKKLGYKK